MNQHGRCLRVIATGRIVDSDRYLELMFRGPEGATAAGLCALLCDLTDPDGHILRPSGKPHTAETIAITLRWPLDLVQRSLELLVDVGLVTMAADDVSPHQHLDRPAASVDASPLVPSATLSSVQTLPELGSPTPSTPPLSPSSIEKERGRGREIGGVGERERGAALHPILTEEWDPIAEESTGRKPIHSRSGPDNGYAHELAQICPDRARRMAAMRAAFANPRFRNGPALKFFVEDFSKWDTAAAAATKSRADVARERHRKAELDEAARNGAPLRPAPEPMPTPSEEQIARFRRVAGLVSADVSTKVDGSANERSSKPP